MKKIAVIGAESTGKSALCAALAQNFDCHWCPEFAREYLLKHGAAYNFEDLAEIAAGQIAQEENYIKKSVQERKEYLFIDTEMYIMKVWYEYAYNRCPYFVLDEIASRTYDYYLLTDIDLPWEPDDLREYPDPESRKNLFCNYKDILVHQNIPWSLVTGTGRQRIENAIDALKDLT